MFNIKEIGKRIQKERKNSKFKSLDELAEEIGTTRQTLSKWEKGDGSSSPSLWDVERLCKIFGCDFGYLVGEYNCRTRINTDIQSETGLSELAIDNLMVGISGIENGGLDITYVNNLHEELRSAEIGRFVKFYFLQLLLENEDIWEQLSVCAFDYRRQIQMSEMDSFHTVEGIPHSQFANVAKNEAKEIISNLFKRIEWDVFSWEDE